MSISSFVGDHTMLIGIAMVGGFVIWKYLLEPIANEGKPITPTEEDIKTFGEKMEDNLNTSVDF